MATNTYVALKTQVLTTNEGGVTFTSLPQGYTDLRIVYSGTGSTTIPFALRFNNDSGSNYSYTLLYGTGSSALSTRGATQTEGYLGNVWSDQNTIIVDLMNYSNSTTYKTAISRANSAGNRVAAWVNLWRSTAAITEILVTATGGGTFQAGSTFTIYGIAAEGALAKATGGAIYSDSQYWYHAFASSGTFTPTQSLTADILVVAGGGAGGVRQAGGGGAGGLLGFSSQSLTATGYTVTVGAGGAGTTTDTSPGANGSDSQFGALTLVKGGGGGGSNSSANGSTGGSGGGGASGGTGGSATSGQGYAGGNGTGAPSYAPGGGGGAGAVGSPNSGSTGGAGGVGLSTYSSWGLAIGAGQNVSGTVYFAGGAGGGSGGGLSGGVAGYGGGGNGGADNNVGSNGLVASGGGGGGSGGSNGAPFNKAGNGGSGIVIVRYAK